MKTQILNPALAHDLNLAVQWLQQGQLVAVPTETVYGLAADARNPEAVAAIFQAKGRPADHPLIVHLPNAVAMRDWAKDIPPEAYRLAEAFWPGPLTLLLHKADQVSTVVTGGLDSIGLRVSAHPVLQRMLNLGQLAVAAPSANPYKKLSPTSAEQVLSGMDGRIQAVVDGGHCAYGLESTIVSLLGAEIQVLRAGPITVDQLEAVLQQPVAYPQQHEVRVSGNVDVHYQPNTPLYCLSHDQLLQALPSIKVPTAVLHWQDVPGDCPIAWRVRMPDSPQAYGQALYRELYHADLQPVAQILLETPPHGDAWFAVHDRLRRAVSSS